MVSGLGTREPVTSPLVCAKGSENPIQFARQSLIKETLLGHHLMLGSAGQFVYKIHPPGGKQRGKMTQTGKIRVIRTIRSINPEDSSLVLRSVI